MKQNRILAGALALAMSMGFAAAADAADAAVVRVAAGAFLPSAGKLTFSEYPLWTVNPVYAPAVYGGDPATAPTVYTGGYFLGRSLSANPGVDCPGASATGCVVGTPTAGLSIDPDSPDAMVVEDGAMPDSPTLSGSPLYNGAIALLFSIDQYAVGFDAGYFDAPLSTAITAFARDGSILGSVKNEHTGPEFLGLASLSGKSEIAGVLFHLVGNEPAGFNIDNVFFGQPKDVDPPAPVPLPAGLPLLASGLAGVAMLRRRRG